MKLLIVPEWLNGAIESNGLSMRDALNPEKLLDILSLDDVAFYLWLNDRSLSNEYYGGLLQSVMDTIDSPLRVENIDDLFPERHRETIQSLIGMYCNPDKKPNISRLFGPFVEPKDINDHGYDLCVIDRDVLAIVPNVMGKYSRNDEKLLDDMLYHLSSRFTFETLAGTPLFQRFLACCMI